MRRGGPRHASKTASARRRAVTAAPHLGRLSARASFPKAAIISHFRRKAMPQQRSCTARWNAAAAGDRRPRTPMASTAESLASHQSVPLDPEHGSGCHFGSPCHRRGMANELRERLDHEIRTGRCACGRAASLAPPAAAGHISPTPARSRSTHEANGQVSFGRERPARERLYNPSEFKLRRRSRCCDRKLFR